MKRLVPASLMLGAAAIAYCAAGLFGRAPGVSGEARRDRPPTESVAPLRAVGVAGCAAAACHGGPATGSLSGTLDARTWAGSATHWLACDPHTKAYDALESPLASAIMNRLQSAVNATEDVRCLACHTNPTLAHPENELSPHERVLQKEGVSCEACHGNAGKWLHEHRNWTKETPRQAAYTDSRMVKLYDLGERALACAGCHVGAPADPARGYPVRDMNHDMIAAGHPRLNFDFADYQRRLPPHWQEKDRATGLPVGADFEVKAWLVGRVAHAEAACRLLADRADRAAKHDPRTPWPEFAELSCVSCHHKLYDKFPRKLGTPTRQPIWPVTEPTTAKAMARFGTLPTLDSPNEKQANAFAEELRLARTRMVLSSDAEVSAVAEALLKSVPVDSLDRDRAGQVYQGLAARERARMKREGRVTFDSAFNCLKESLAAPRGKIDFAVKPEAIDALKMLLSE